MSQGAELSFIYIIIEVLLVEAGVMTFVTHCTFLLINPRRISSTFHVGDVITDVRPAERRS